MKWSLSLTLYNSSQLALLQSSAGMAGGIKYILLSHPPTDSQVRTVQLLGKVRSICRGSSCLFI
jgi:hypothetical protein